MKTQIFDAETELKKLLKDLVFESKKEARLRKVLKIMDILFELDVIVKVGLF